MGDLRSMLVVELDGRWPGGPVVRDAMSPGTTSREQIGSLAGNVPMDAADDPEGLPDHLLQPTVSPEDCFGPVPPAAEDPGVHLDPYARDTGPQPMPGFRR